MKKKKRNYLNEALARIKKINAGTFNYSKAYENYLKTRSKRMMKRKLQTDFLSFESFKSYYKRAVRGILEGEIKSTYIASIGRLIVESEVESSVKQIKTWMKMAQKKFKDTGDEKFNIKPERWWKEGFSVIESLYSDNKGKSFREVFYN